MQTRLPAAWVQRALQVPRAGLGVVADVARIVPRPDIASYTRRLSARLFDFIAVNDLIELVDVDAIVKRVDVDAIVARVDIDRLLAHVDIQRLIDRVDVNVIVSRVDVDALVERTDLGAVIAQSTGGVASGAVDMVRRQGVGLDEFVATWATRVRRRRLRDAPAGPPLLAPGTNSANAE